MSIDPDGVATVLAQLVDIDARKAQGPNMEKAARHDPLTSLANRSQLSALIQAQSDAGPQVTTGVLFPDPDGFKAVNDSYGHDAGDAVLVEVARRLTNAVRPGDTVLRLRGDEFVVLCAMPARTPEGPLQDLARRLEDAVGVPVGCNGKQVQVGASVGAALAQPGQFLAALVEAADAAMYRCKAERSIARSPLSVPCRAQWRWLTPKRPTTPGSRPYGDESGSDPPRQRRPKQTWSRRCSRHVQ